MRVVSATGGEVEQPTHALLTEQVPARLEAHRAACGHQDGGPGALPPRRVAAPPRETNTGGSLGARLAGGQPPFTRLALVSLASCTCVARYGATRKNTS